MGLSCAVIYDAARKEYHVFDEFDLDDLKKRLEKTDLVVGHNILKFDNKLLAAYDINIPQDKCYDTLVEIARSAGTPGNFKGLSLDAIAAANLQITKNGNGADAPKLYQKKTFGRLFNYCLADVRITKLIFDKILETGHLINPRNNQWIRVRRPQ